MYANLLNAPAREDVGKSLYATFLFEEREKARIAQGLDKLPTHEQPSTKDLSLNYVSKPKIPTKSQLI